MDDNAFSITDLQRLLATHGTWTTTLPLHTFKSALELLDSVTRPPRVALNDLKECREHVQEQINRLPALHFLAPLRDVTGTTLVQTQTLEHNRQLLTTQSAALTSAMRLVDRVREMCRRLEQEPRWPKAVTPASQGSIEQRIHAVLQPLEDYGDALAEELKRIDTNEGAAVELVTRWAQSTADSWKTGPAHQEFAEISGALEILFRGRVRTDRREQLAPVVNDTQLLAVIVAYFHLHAGSALLDLLVGLVGDVGLTRLTVLLSALGSPTLCVLAERDTIPPVLGDALCLLALRNRHQALLEMLVPSLGGSPGIVAFARAILDESRQHGLSKVADRVIWCLRTQSAHAGSSGGDESDTLRNNLLARIEHSPGMTKLHHTLRVHARTLFLRPLQRLVEEGDTAGALEWWMSSGSRDEQVQACIAKLSHQDARNLEDTHRRNTSSYLDSFEQELLAWQVTTRAQSPDDTLEVLVTRLRTSGQHRDEDFARVLEAIVEAPPVEPLFHDLKQVLPERSEAIEPAHTESFILRCHRRAVPPALYISDCLRLVLAADPRSQEELVGHYLSRNAIDAAQETARGHPQLTEEVDRAIERLRAEFRERHQTLLADARKIAAENDEVSEYVEFLEMELREAQFVTAEELIEELSEQVRLHHLLQDPERSYAIEFLRDFEQDPAVEAPLSHLYARVDELRAEHADRRGHIGALQELFDQPIFGKFIVSQRPSVLRRIDRRGGWPQTRGEAQSMARSIEIATRFLTTQVQYQAQQPEVVAALLQRVPQYIVDRCKTLADDATQNPLRELLDLIEAFHPAQRVLDFVGSSAQAAGTDAGAPGVRLASMRRHRQAPPPARESADDIRARIQQAIAQQSEEWLEEDPGNLTIQGAIKISDWNAVRQIAARKIRAREHASLENPSLSVYEAIFAFAQVREQLVVQRAARSETSLLLAIAVFWSRPTLRGWLRKEAFERLLDDVLGGESLVERLKTLSGGSLETPGYAWLTTMMSVASRIRTRDAELSSQIAELLWNAVPQPTVKSRTDLLHWLHRMRRDEALRYLAKHAPQPDFVKQCIRAFERAESAPEVRPAALQMAAAFREQSGRQRNTKPWVMLFLRLEQISQDIEHDALPVKISTIDSVVERAGDETFGLDLYIEPVLSADPPEVLELRLPNGGKAVDLIRGEEGLLSPKTITITCALPETAKGGDIIEVPYVASGRTFGGRKIEARDQLSVELAGTKPPPLDNNELLRAWPGASGDPVRHLQGFFGRERECQQIQRRICDDDRPRSLMLFGQRRVGKTSILLELVRRFPPDERRVTGVFVDVSSVELPPDRSMSQQFFNKIVDALDDPRNKNVRDALGSGRTTSVRKLLRGIDPSLSLFTALHSLRERLCDASGGRIQRLTLFIDEFDRFVEPLMEGNEAEKSADRMMWDLRQIIQQSEYISLVLAGSGLQKRFTAPYQRPLYGSIDPVEIIPFDWEEDRDAILDIFLPERIRARLCRDANVDDVGRYATEMCGGHPYFLALVGQAAGMFARGRTVNVHLINLAARKLIDGDIPELPRHVNASLFFAHILETLRRVPLHEQKLARLILGHIASRTTESLPWLNRDDASDVPDVLNESEMDRERALQLLIEEGAVVEQGQRVRIAVPLTALAVRNRANLLRHEALQDTASGSRDA